jgi:hypothetical protein
MYKTKYKELAHLTKGHKEMRLLDFWPQERAYRLLIHNTEHLYSFMTDGEEVKKTPAQAQKPLVESTLRPIIEWVEHGLMSTYVTDKLASGIRFNIPVRCVYSSDPMYNIPRALRPKWVSPDGYGRVENLHFFTDIKNGDQIHLFGLRMEISYEPEQIVNYFTISPAIYELRTIICEL